MLTLLLECFRGLLGSISSLGGAGAGSGGSIIKFRRSGLDVVCNERSTELDSDHVLGEGAFSTVFIGVDANPKYGHPTKKYAVKRMYLQSEEFERAYTEEVASFSRFPHPNVMTLLDAQSSSQEDTPAHCRTAYLLFPLMCGSLRDQLNDTVLSPGWTDNVSNSVNQRRFRQTLQQFVDVCRAFNCLHTHSPMQYVHQDIKPENILIRTLHENHHSSGSSSKWDSMWEGGTPLLTDFGSVRPAVIHIKDRPTSLRVADEAASFCTVSYRSPELFDPPKGSTLDTRTDVWGLGCLLFAWWFGYSPFESEFVVNDRGQCEIKVTDCGHSKVLSKMPRKPDKHCSQEDRKILRLSGWILEQDFTKRVYTDDVITAVEDELR
eukprot:GSChrysophyteH2.ASY1.ANO1.781.1 assembled CDS